MSKYAIGLDYGTNSVRALIVAVSNGKEVGESVWNYKHGENGIILSHDPNLARQHPADYLEGAEIVIKGALSQARKKVRNFSPEQIIGIGVDATGSTPLPVDKEGIPIAFQKQFTENPDAMAWLWKDHTSIPEAEEITKLAAKLRPHYLAKCGGTYSSEWFFSKILRCIRTNPRVAQASYTWVEIADWIPAMLTGTTAPDKITVGICTAGHKGMYNDSWGGYPDVKFLRKLSPELAKLRSRLPGKAKNVSKSVGGLNREWASRTGVPEGIPVAAGAIDAHLGAVGSGISVGKIVQILGTSSCDMVVSSLRKPLPDIPGLCGIVPESILPGFYGMEAGQAAVGDIYNWFVNYIAPGGKKAGSHGELTKQAKKLKPGESGLLALDWNNGNRTILVDQRLTGLLIGQTLQTTPAEIYRALIEATAFGTLTIINRFEEYGVPTREIINCGGIAEKNPLVMQIYADVTGRPMKIARSSQACALGAAIAGAVVAGKRRGGYSSFASAQKAMTGLKSRVYKPDRNNQRIYRELYKLYKQLHDCFGTSSWNGNLFDVMKNLIAIRNEARNR